MAQGADVELAEVKGVKINGNEKIVETDGGTYTAKAVIIATGAKHRLLGLENEEKLVGNGISFCAVCDGAFYQGQRVAVIGGGNSALQEALLLSDLVEKLYVVQNLDYFTGEQKLVEQLLSKPNVEVFYGALATEYIGESEITGLKIKDVKSGEEKILDVSGVFVAVGLVPQNEPFKDVLTLNAYGYADADESCKTATGGVFVAGDCRSKRIRQVTTAASDGAIAALAACDYLDKLN